MGFCDPANMYDATDPKPTGCPSGYDAYYNSCCNHAMYIFWYSLSWVALCGCCALCIFMWTSRMR